MASLILNIIFITIAILLGYFAGHLEHWTFVLIGYGTCLWFNSIFGKGNSNREELTNKAR